jgi:hypothetical protein
VFAFFFELGASCICPVYYRLRPFALFEYTYQKEEEDGLQPEVAALPPADVSAPFGGLVLDSKGFELSSLGAPVLGERIRFSLPVMLEIGAPIYMSKSKLVMAYHRR